MTAPILPSGSELQEWDGMCLELVDALLHEHPSGRILYVELEDVPGPWRYHAALVLGGIVYDAWHPSVKLPPAEYVQTVFGLGIEWELIG